MADESVLNWPDVAVEGLTTIEPDGGVVLEAAYTRGKKARTTEVGERCIANGSLNGRYASGDLMFYSFEVTSLVDRSVCTVLR